MVLPHPKHSFRRVRLVGSTRRVWYCDYCNAYTRKSRSWHLVAIGMQVLGLAGVLNSNCSMKLFDF